MSVSLGYFLYDMVCSYLLDGELAFVFHHMATIFGFAHGACLHLDSHANLTASRGIRNCHPGQSDVITARRPDHGILGHGANGLPLHDGDVHAVASSARHAEGGRGSGRMMRRHPPLSEGILISRP